MTTFKRVSVLAGILFTGFLMLSSFPIAGQSTLTLPSFGTAQQECLNDNVTISGCLVVAKGLNGVSSVVGSGSTQGLNVLLLGQLKKVLNLPSGTTCNSCEAAAHNFETLLASNQTIQSIENTLYQACAVDYTDFNSQNACDLFVDEYVPNVIEYVVKNLPPATLCTNLSYCSTN